MRIAFPTSLFFIHMIKTSKLKHSLILYKQNELLMLDGILNIKCEIRKEIEKKHR